MDYNPKSGFKAGYHEACILDIHRSRLLYGRYGGTLWITIQSQDLRQDTIRLVS